LVLPIKVIDISCHQIAQGDYSQPHPLLQCESKNPPGVSDIFPKQLGSFNQFLHTNYRFLSTLDCKFFIQLSPTVTKLCHINCDHPACVSADGGQFEYMM